MLKSFLSVTAVAWLLSSGLSPLAIGASPAPTSLQFDIDFEAGHQIGDRFDPTGGAKINTISAKPDGVPPYRKLTDIRNALNGKQGNWTATVAAGAPFETQYLRFDVPAGQALAGRFELFKPTDKAQKGTWFYSFDYARFTEGKGGPELAEVQFKTRSGGIATAPAMWYGVWLGDWRNTASNRDLTVGKLNRIRTEVDFDAGRYRLFVNGEKVEEGKCAGGDFGGVSFVFMNKTADHPLAFGIDNVQSGSMVTGPLLSIKGEVVVGDGRVSNLLSGDDYVTGKKPVDFTLTVVNRYPDRDVKHSVSLELFNHRGKVKDLGLQAIELVPAEQKAIPLSITVPAAGWYAVHATQEEDGKSASTPIGSFCVLRPVAEGIKPQSLFGFCMGDRPQDLETAKLLGVKWRRGIPFTHPNIVYKDGKPWDGEAVDRAKAAVAAWKDAGVMLLGYVDYNWVGNLESEKRKQTWHFRPKDMDVHAEMVYQLIKPLADQVQFWELWNEATPLGHYWSDGTAQDYRDMTRVVWDRVKPEFPNVSLLAGSYTWFQRDVLFATGSDNAGYLDGVSTHPYGKPNRFTPVSTAQEAAMLKQSAKGDWKNAGIWITEIGTPEWEFTAHPVDQRQFMVARSVAPIYLLSQLGAGDVPVKVFFFTSKYEDSRSADDNFNLWQGRNPKPGLMAFNVMASLLEGATLRGDLFALTPNAWALHYVLPDGSSVVATWPEVNSNRDENETGQMVLPAEDFEAVDYLGHTIGTRQGDTLVLPTRVWEATYIRSKRTPEQVTAAFAQAKLTTGQPLRVVAESFTKPLDMLPPLRVKVQNHLMQATDVELTILAPPGISIAQTQQTVSALKPGETRTIDFAITSAKADANNRYAFDISARTGEQTVKAKQDVQVACATYGTPKIDGDLADWADAVSVTIAHRSPFSDWGKESPPMLAHPYRLWTKWDEKNFFIAASLYDPTPNASGQPQNTSGFMHDNDALQLGFNLLDNNPDDLLQGNPLYNKSLASDIDYEFNAGPVKLSQNEIAGQIRRMMAPGTRYQHHPNKGLDNAQTQPPIGPLEASAAGGNDGQIVINYDPQTKFYTYELAIPLRLVPELQARLETLQAGGTAEAKFAFRVCDDDKWLRGSHWQEEANDVELAATGFSPRMGTPRWTNNFALRLQTPWGFVRPAR